MDSMDYWRLCDELSVIQAALLIAGADPSTAHVYVERWNIERRPDGYEAAKAALKNAIRSKRLPAIVRYEAHPRGYNEQVFIGMATFVHNTRKYVFKEEPDWEATTITVDDLKHWLTSRGFRTGFFFPEADARPDYLNPASPCYAMKLAAALDAWEAVSREPELKRGKSVKQSLMKWLRIHAAKYDLIKEDGNPNESGIEEIAKIANWDTKGGAPRTPEPLSLPAPLPNLTSSNLPDLDEVPF